MTSTDKKKGKKTVTVCTLCRVLGDDSKPQSIHAAEAYRRLDDAASGVGGKHRGAGAPGASLVFGDVDEAPPLLSDVSHGSLQAGGGGPGAVAQHDGLVLHGSTTALLVQTV